MVTNKFNGIFTMENGIISDNNSTSSGPNIQSWGGGVFLGSFSTFTMISRKISGNTTTSTGSTARAYGGGVMIQDGTFDMHNGEIFGSEELINIRNSAGLYGFGASFFRLTGTAQYGRFIGNIWNSNGDLTSTDNTINVSNGM
ncbi:MAG: hypothetical protein LBC80_02580 [Treponema sp.]|jgi:hypothetical protein|nr:hypothetical protein [Treponema sp.]